MEKTLDSIRRYDETKGVNTTLQSWYSDSEFHHASHETLFSLFQKKVNILDLWVDHCLLRIRQKMRGQSLKFLFFHPEHKVYFEFKVPADCLPPGYSSWGVQKLVAELVRARFYVGMKRCAETEYPVKRIEPQRESSDIELLNMLNSRLERRLGSKAWKGDDNDNALDGCFDLADIRHG